MGHESKKVKKRKKISRLKEDKFGLEIKSKPWLTALISTCC